MASSKEIFSKQKRNSIFLKIIGTILIFVLILITLIFLIIYSNIKEQSLEQAYTNEQENLSAINYSATIMADTATSLLNQLNNDPKIHQLMYANILTNLETINAANLFQNYVSSSLWFDSAYIYNAIEDSFIYVYTNADYTTYSISFSSSDMFWDYEFTKHICDIGNSPANPTIREITTPAFKNTPQKVFTYYLPIKNRPNSYDGIFVINIRAQKLMDLCYGITNNTSRQIIVSDGSGNYYSSNSDLLNTDTQELILQNIFDTTESTGHDIIPGRTEKVFYTWNKSNDSPYIFISGIPYSNIVEQLEHLRMWLVTFYCSVLLISVCSILLLMKNINKEYLTLQKQYQITEKQYLDNHGVIKDSLLRNFLTEKNNCFMIVERFAENKIYLETYSAYNLVLIETKSISPVDKNPKIILRSVLSKVISDKLQFEAIDVLQNRHLLILECSDETDLIKILQNLSDELLEKYNYSARGLFQIGINSLNDIPHEYQKMVQQFELLYFYQPDAFINISHFTKRARVGYNDIAKLCPNLLEELENHHFTNASLILSEFFDAWFEPFHDVHRTINYLVKKLFIYMNNFAHTHTVPMDFDIMAFQNNIYRCEYAQNVKMQFLSLLDDIQSVFVGIGQRSNYIDILLNQIHKNYHDPNLNVDALADSVGLSSSHMQSVFKSSTGISVSGYLRRYRLEKSAELLSDTALSINEIAASTGFGNANYFYTIFKKHYSITPSEYRNQHKTPPS